VRVILAVFELVVGLAFGFAIFVLFASMAGAAEFEVTIHGILFWLALGLGPILLVVGPVLALARPMGKLGSTLVLAGAAILTCWAVYFAVAVPTGQRDGGLDLRRLLIPLLVLAVAFASDVAAYRIWRSVGTGGPGAMR